MYPYTTTSLKIVVTQVKIDSTGKATVDWSDAYNSTALTKGAIVNFSKGLGQALAERPGNDPRTWMEEDRICVGCHVRNDPKL